MINYQTKLDELINSLTTRPTLLLHSCCGPCSTQVINYLAPYFNITIYYYNPNIEPEGEYEKRKKEQLRFIASYNKDNCANPIHFLDCDYDNSAFKAVALGLEKEREGGARCHKCMFLRLEKTALKAKNEGFNYFGTTLSVSPHKNSQVINQSGEYLAQKYQIPFIYGDFKKGNGYQKSIEFSKKYALYRQNYCGCLYAKGVDQ